MRRALGLLRALQLHSLSSPLLIPSSLFPAFFIFVISYIPSFAAPPSARARRTSGPSHLARRLRLSRTRAQRVHFLSFPPTLSFSLLSLLVSSVCVLMLRISQLRQCGGVSPGVLSRPSLSGTGRFTSGSSLLGPCPLSSAALRLPPTPVAVTASPKGRDAEHRLCFGVVLSLRVA